MAISIDWGTRVINVPQSYLTNITGTLYELDTDQFRLDLKNLEDDPEGMPFPDTHRHNTQVTVAGVTYARVIEIINGYQIEFEDGQYSVRLVGSNNNFFDVENGVLAQNQVQVIPGNAAGLIVAETGVSGLTQEESDALIAIAAAQTVIQSNISTINTNVATITLDIAIIRNTQIDIEDALVRALGLMQENFAIDQQSYVDYQGQKLLVSARIRLYSDAASVGTDNNVVHTYAVAATWNGQEQLSYTVKKLAATTTTSTTTTGTTTT